VKISFHAPENVVSWTMLLRFALGGAVSVVASITSVVVNARAAGVLLAFPTIMPAALTFLQERKGKKATESDAHGAFFGSLGLLAFALILIPLSTRLPGAAALVVVGLVWLVVSIITFAVLHNRGPFRHVDQRA